MCLVIIHVGKETVTIAANRDEYFKRPTSRAQMYQYPSSNIADNPFRKSIDTPDPVTPLQVYGARDEKCDDEGNPLRGSPFLTASGERWAVITNATRQVVPIVTSSNSNIYLKSRGHIVSSFVCSNISPLKFIEKFDQECLSRDFDGFNLIFGIGLDAYAISNRKPNSNFNVSPIRVNGSSNDDNNLTNRFKNTFVKKLSVGRCYGVSNSFLDAPEPRIDRGKASMKGIIENLIECSKTEKHNQCKKKFAEDLLQIMTDDTPCSPYSTFVPFPLNKVFINKIIYFNPDSNAYRYKTGMIALDFVLIFILSIYQSVVTNHMLDFYGTRTSTVLIVEKRNGQIGSNYYEKDYVSFKQ